MVMFGNVFRMALLVMSFGVLAACGGTVVKVGLSSTANLNLNSDNEPLPVVVRIYQLSDRTSFENTTFNDIWKRDLAVLGDAMLTRQEVVINPGSQNRIEFDRHDQAKYIGVVAIFRNPVEKRWRDVYELSTSFAGKRFSPSFSVSLIGSTLEISD